MSVAQILSRLSDFPTRYAVVTGGEPLIAAGIEELCAGLRDNGYHITIETAGVTFKQTACDLASVSPKLTNSIPHQREDGRWAERHDQQRLRPDAIQAFMEQSDYQLKFVLSRAEDIAEVRAIVDSLRGVDPAKVLLMPQGTTREELDRRGAWLVEVCKQHGFRFCPRLHIELFGNRRGT